MSCPSRRVGLALLAIGIAGFGACARGDDAPGTPAVAATIAPAPARLRRLSAHEYANSIEALLGPDARAVAAPPADSSLNGFIAIAASQLALSDDLIGSYELSARAIAAAAAADHDRIDAIAGCAPVGDDDPECLASFVDRFGRLAFRRPLSDEERDELAAVAGEGQDYGGHYAGVEITVYACLQAPSFLYRAELGVEQPQQPALRPLDGYEVASRMSFFLLGTTPSTALLDRAAAGELDSADGARRVAADLLATPEARLAVADFFAEYLEIADLEDVKKDLTVFPTFSSELALAMKEETLALVADVVWEREAAIQELIVWPEDEQRAGLLSQASILTRHAHATSTSPTLRGLFVLQRLMCQDIPPPPPGVVTELPPSSEAPTMRERLAVHMADPSCAGCHAVTDSLGLALENFDGIGRYRETENGADIDPSGELDDLGAFSGPEELAALLSGSPDVSKCLLRNLFRHATGHVEVDGEIASLDRLHEVFAESGFRFQALLVELTASAAFRNVGALEEE